MLSIMAQKASKSALKIHGLARSFEDFKDQRYYFTTRFFDTVYFTVTDVKKLRR